MALDTDLAELPGIRSETDGGGGDSVEGHRFDRRDLAVLFLVVTAGRCIFNADRKVFSLFPDEPASLAMARWISGGPHWDMYWSSTWRPGYATLLAPIFWLTEDQEWIVRMGLLLNACIGGLSVVLLAVLASRLTTLSTKAALVVCAAIGLSAPSLSASAHLWAEPLVTLTFLGTVWSILRFFDRPTLALGASAVVCAGAGYISHSRLLPLVFTATVLPSAAFFVRGRRVQAFGLVGLGIAVLALATFYSSRVYDALWDDPNDINTVSGVAKQLGDPVSILSAASGQIWYLLVSTGGVFGIGVSVLAARCIGRGTGPSTLDARLIAALTLPLIGLSMVFMADRPRGDHLIYGRYNDAVVWPVLVVAGAWLLQTRPTAWQGLERSRQLVFVGIAAVIVETALIVHLVLGDELVDREAVIEMIPGIVPLTGGSRVVQTFVPTLAGVAGLTLIALSLRLARRRARVIFAVVAVALVGGGFRTHSALSRNLNPGGSTVAVRHIDRSILPDDVPLVYGFVPDELNPGVPNYKQGYYAQLYQWYLPDHRFDVIQTGEYPAEAFVFAPLGDPLLRRRGATLLWIDDQVDIALWRTPPG